jgi:hypothetical protein
LQKARREAEELRPIVLELHRAGALGGRVARRLDDPRDLDRRPGERIARGSSRSIVRSKSASTRASRSPSMRKTRLKISSCSGSRNSLIAVTV